MKYWNGLSLFFVLNCFILKHDLQADQSQKRLKRQIPNEIEENNIEAFMMKRGIPIRSRSLIGQSSEVLPDLCGDGIQVCFRETLNKHESIWKSRFQKYPLE